MNSRWRCFECPTGRTYGSWADHYRQAHLLVLVTQTSPTGRTYGPRDGD